VLIGGPVRRQFWPIPHTMWMCAWYKEHMTDEPSSLKLPKTLMQLFARMPTRCAVRLTPRHFCLGEVRLLLSAGVSLVSKRTESLSGRWRHTDRSSKDGRKRMPSAYWETADLVVETKRSASGNQFQAGRCSSLICVLFWHRQVKV